MQDNPERDGLARPPVAPAEPNWDTVAIDYQTGHLTLPALCRKHGITRSTLLLRATRHKWRTLRTEDTDRLILIDMLFGALERQIAHLETVEMTRTGDKEVVVLGKLAATLEKLVDIEDRSKAPAGSGENMKELRIKLARRIENLKRS